jgi:hypothetical protein
MVKGEDAMAGGAQDLASEYRLAAPDQEVEIGIAYLLNVGVIESIDEA